MKTDLAKDRIFESTRKCNCSWT